jgi:hypothetical protein
MAHAVSCKLDSRIRVIKRKNVRVVVYIKIHNFRHFSCLILVRNRHMSRVSFSLLHDGMSLRTNLVPGGRIGIGELVGLENLKIPVRLTMVGQMSTPRHNTSPS